MTDKLFSHAGFSLHKGSYKARFANDALRVKVLEKDGHTDIQMTALIQPSTKQEAVEALLKANFAGENALAKAALEAELDKRSDAPKAVKATPKAKAAPKAKAKKDITLDSIMAKAITSPVEIPQVAAKEKSRAEIQAELDAMDAAPF